MSTMVATSGKAAGMTKDERFVILASSLGTVFEWYDFYLFGSLASVIGAQFFGVIDPATNQPMFNQATRELHGYGIVQAADEAFPDQPPLDVGSLYRIVSRMLHDGLIREVPPPASWTRNDV